MIYFFLILIGLLLDILQNIVLIIAIKGKQMVRRLCRISFVSFSPLSQGEELAKRGFVFVGQAHKSPDASQPWAKLWKPSKVGDPFHLLVSISLPLPQAGWNVPSPWRTLVILLFCF